MEDLHINDQPLVVKLKLVEQKKPALMSFPDIVSVGTSLVLLVGHYLFQVVYLIKLSVYYP